MRDTHMTGLSDAIVCRLRLVWGLLVVPTPRKPCGMRSQDSIHYRQMSASEASEPDFVDIQAPLYPTFCSPPSTKSMPCLAVPPSLQLHKEGCACVPAEACLGNSLVSYGCFRLSKSRQVVLRSCGWLAGGAVTYKYPLWPVLVDLSCCGCPLQDGAPRTLESLEGTRYCHVRLEGYPGSAFLLPSLPRCIRRRRRCVVEDIPRLSYCSFSSSLFPFFFFHAW